MSATALILPFAGSVSGHLARSLHELLVGPRGSDCIAHANARFCSLSAAFALFGMPFCRPSRRSPVFDPPPSILLLHRVATFAEKVATLEPLSGSKRHRGRWTGPIGAPLIHTLSPLKILLFVCLSESITARWRDLKRRHRTTFPAVRRVGPYAAAILICPLEPTPRVGHHRRAPRRMASSVTSAATFRTGSFRPLAALQPFGPGLTYGEIPQ